MLPSPVRLERLRRGLSQAAVARALHIDQTLVSLLERGCRLTGPAFRHLAAYYGCPFELLHRRMLKWGRTVGRSIPALPASLADRTVVKPAEKARRVA